MIQSLLNSHLEGDGGKSLLVHSFPYDSPHPPERTASSSWIAWQATKGDKMCKDIFTHQEWAFWGGAATKELWSIFPKIQTVSAYTWGQYFTLPHTFQADPSGKVGIWPNSEWIWVEWLESYQIPTSFRAKNLNSDFYPFPAIPSHSDPFRAESEHIPSKFFLFIFILIASYHMTLIIYWITQHHYIILYCIINLYTRLLTMET